MKHLMVLGTLVFTVLTAVEPVLAQDESTVRASVEEDDSNPRLSDLGVHVNPQLGLSSFEYSGQRGNGKQKLSGGVTVELGGPARRVETGLLLLQTGADATFRDGSQGSVVNTFLALPLMAKLRIFSMRSQSWYAKLGALTAFATQSNNRVNTSAVDVLGSVGVGGRVAFTTKADFIIEATYNRGFIDALESATTTNYNQGYLVLAGVSFGI